MRSRPRISMRESLGDPDLFGTILAGSSWYSWRVLLIASAGEPLSDDERQEFRKLTGRDREPLKFCRELIVIAGRRGGKSTAMCVFAIWIACLCDHRGVLAPGGEIGVCLLVSRDQRVSRMLVDRIAEMMALSSPLHSMIINRTQDTIELSNHVRIELRPASYINLRGPTYLCILADEVAFWFTSTDFANPDTEILAAARPGLLTSRGPLVMISSAYSQTGVLYDSWRQYFGPGGPNDVIVAYGTSRDFNPSLDQTEIDRALERDPTRNRAEYLSEWRTDTSGFIDRAIIAACVGDYVQLSPQPGITYRCFIDQASGVPEGDSYAMTIAHKSGETVITDAVREVQPPFSPAAVVNEILLPLCKAYGVHSVTSDNYASGFSQNLIRSAGLGFEPAKKHKSELYLELLPLLNSRRISLPRSDRLVNQIASLERSTQRSGRDFIDHGPHGHDDLANAVAGAADLVYNFTLFDIYTLVDGAPRAAQLPAEQEAERRRKVADDYYRVDLYRSLGLPPPAPPWGIPRSKTPEQERGEAEAHAQWRWMMYMRSVGSSGWW
jgi:hypothetical protein